MADCFKYRNKIGVDVAIEALRDTLRKKKAKVDEIRRFASVQEISGQASDRGKPPERRLAAKIGCPTAVQLFAGHYTGIRRVAREMRADLAADGFEKWPATAGDGHHGDLYLSGDKQRHPGGQEWRRASRRPVLARGQAEAARRSGAWGRGIGNARAGVFDWDEVRSGDRVRGPAPLSGNGYPGTELFVFT